MASTDISSRSFRECKVWLEYFSPDPKSEMYPMVGLCGHSCSISALKGFFESNKRLRFSNCLEKCARTKQNGGKEYIKAYDKDNLVPNYSFIEVLKAIDVAEEELDKAISQEEKLEIFDHAEEEEFQKCGGCKKAYNTDKIGKKDSKYHDQAPIVGKCGHTFCTSCIYKAHARAQAECSSPILLFACPSNGCRKPKAFHSLELYENLGFLFALRYWEALRQKHLDLEKDLEEEAETSPVEVQVEDRCSRWSILPSKDARENDAVKPKYELIKQEPTDDDTHADNEVDCLSVHSHQERDSLMDEEAPGEGFNGAGDGAMDNNADETTAEGQEKEIIEILENDSDDEAVAATGLHNQLGDNQECRTPTAEENQILKNQKYSLTFLCRDEFKSTIHWHIYDQSKLVCIAPDSYVKETLLNEDWYNHMILQSKSTNFKSLQYSGEQNEWLVETFNRVKRPVDEDFVQATFKSEFIDLAKQNPSRSQKIEPWHRVFPRINPNSATLSLTSIKYRFKESSSEWKLMHAFASALHAAGFEDKANEMYEKWRTSPSDDMQISRLGRAVSCLPNSSLQHKVVNEEITSRNFAVFEHSRSDAIMVVRPSLGWNQITCFLVVYRDLIFEPMCLMALPLNQKNLDVCCAGEGQFKGIKESWTLSLPPRKRKADCVFEVIEVDD